MRCKTNYGLQHRHCFVHPTDDTEITNYHLCFHHGHAHASIAFHLQSTEADDDEQESTETQPMLGQRAGDEAGARPAPMIDHRAGDAMPPQQFDDDGSESVCIRD
jgi:hypothetical protein